MAARWQSLLLRLTTRKSHFRGQHEAVFYRIDAGALIDFATDVEGESITLLQFAKDLQKGKSDVAFIQSIIEEAANYIETKKEAGRRGGLAKASNALAKASTALALPSTALAKASTPLASSSNRKEKEINKEKEKHPYRENVLLTSDEYQKLIDQYGQSHVEKMLDKLAGYKLSKGKTYKSDYGAILQWVVEAVPAPTYQVTTAPTTPQPYC